MNIELQEYNKDLITLDMLNGYQLGANEHIGKPQSIIERSQMDSNLKPIMILDYGRIVGCFGLHTNDGPIAYGGNPQTDILLRAFSIDYRYRRRDYALVTLLKLSEFVYFHYDQVDRIILGVNYANTAAQALYKKAGFVDSKRRFAGKLGEILIYQKELK
ncbi:hypothetical protein CPR19088_GLDEOEPO_00231 [Companilactobacillus paralimentarius]